MEPLEWNRVEAAFHRALGLPPGERQHLIDELARERPDLSGELAAMLVAHEAESALDAPAIQVAPIAPGAPGVQPELIGCRVGPYEIECLLGSGGMGSVYLARRADGRFEKKVAVKLISTGVMSEESLRRFATESQVLAQLEHPNIARLLDAGRLEDGSPYLVMEYVEGEPIDRWCADHAASVTERLGLFREVCAAVHHAHRNLVVHRDIKPSNVLVGPQGGAKLLDFGIAKILVRDDDPTGTTERLFTPHFASPEQLLGGPITTSTDVYSLGVLLYVLLVGKRPFDAPTNELLRAICEEPPPRPSKAVDDSRLSRQLAGDLDNITLMALRKEPERRYPSVDELATDVQRHLAGRPVVARKDTRVYRASKFVRRNRVACAAAALALFFALAGTIESTVQAARAKRSAEFSQMAFKTAARLADALNPTLRREFSMKDVLAETEALEELLREGEPYLDREDRIHFLSRVFDVYESLERGQEVYPWAEQILEFERERLSEDDPRLAALLLRYSRFAPRLADRELMVEEALAIYERNDDSLGIARVRTGVAHVLAATQPAQASELYDEVTEAYRELDSVPSEDLAKCLLEHGRLLAGLDRYQESEAKLSEALERATGDDLLFAGASSSLAGLLQDRGRLDEAAVHYENALATNSRLLPADHPMIGRNMSQLSLVYKDLGQYEKALSLSREAVEIVQDFGRKPLALAEMWEATAKIYADQGDFTEAEVWASNALSSYRELDQPVLEAVTLTLLGRAHVGRGAFGEAKAVLEAAVDLNLRIGRTDWEAAKSRSLLGEALTGLGEYERAQPLIEKSYPIIKEDRGIGHRRTIQAAERAVVLYEAWGKPEELAVWRERLRENREAALRGR